jgi:hypothetical protein
LLYYGGAPTSVHRGQLSHPFNELLDFPEYRSGILFPALENCHPARGQAYFPQQPFDGFGALVRPQIALEVAALVLLAGHNRHTVRAGFKRLKQVRNIHLSGTGQTDGPNHIPLVFTD